MNKKSFTRHQSQTPGSHSSDVPNIGLADNLFYVNNDGRLSGIIKVKLDPNIMLHISLYITLRHYNYMYAVAFD